MVTVVDLATELVMLVDFDLVVEMTPGSGLLETPPAKSPYPANAKFSRLVSRLVGRPLVALASEPPRPVAGDRHRFRLSR